VKQRIHAATAEWRCHGVEVLMRVSLEQGKAGMAMYTEFEQDRDRGNFEKLPELHAVLSGMKVCFF
jgi:hypothetical protein